MVMHIVAKSSTCVAAKIADLVVAYLKRLRSLDTIAITPDDRKRVEFWDRARRQARGR